MKLMQLDLLGLDRPHPALQHQTPAVTLQQFLRHVGSPGPGRTLGAGSIVSRSRPNAADEPPEHKQSSSGFAPIMLPDDCLPASGRRRAGAVFSPLPATPVPQAQCDRTKTRCLWPSWPLLLPVWLSRGVSYESEMTKN